jgi:broad specificity phosphatase PhoE
MKTVYFVRHGESEGNVGPIRQTAVTPLTEKGIVQVKVLAERCSKLPVEIILSSTMVRAKETTEFISEKLSRPIEYSDLFVERRRPTVMLGNPKDHPEAMEADKTIQENFHLPRFRFSDEENFEDLKTRAKEALEHLFNRKEENILVVTHGFFMRIVLAYVLMGEELTAKECVRFIRTVNMENTGISVFEYESKWKLWIWNDHAHLG